MSLTGGTHLSGTTVLKKVGNCTELGAMKVVASASDTPCLTVTKTDLFQCFSSRESLLHYPVPKLCHEREGHFYRIHKDKNKQRVRGRCHPYSQQKNLK